MFWQYLLFGKFRLSAQDLRAVLGPLYDYATVLDITRNTNVLGEMLDVSWFRNPKRLIDEKVFYPFNEMVGMVCIPVKLTDFPGWGNTGLIKYDMAAGVDELGPDDQVGTMWNILSYDRYLRTLNWPSRYYIGGNVYKKKELKTPKKITDAFNEFTQYITQYKQYFDSVKQACRY